jgi:EAL domain-containing protein (putative c-di-GMP-specific phosphodiesterase class I)
MKKWAKEKKRLVKVSINISRKTVYDDGLIDFLSDKLKENGIDPKLLDMELTESLAARDTAFLLQLVNKIKALRMNTSIDDFGVGYSSFNSLKKLPFDTLKIDKSFIDDIEVDQKSRDIVKAIINLSHALGIWTIAEGVETREQVEILKYLGLDSIQGYYYSRPLNNYEFQKFLADNPFERKEEEQ